MRRLVYLIVVPFLLVGGVVWLAQSYSVRWEPQLRKHLERSASRSARAAIKIGHISYSPFRGIVLDYVEGKTDDESGYFFARSVQVSVSFIDLPIALVRGDPAQALGVVSIDSPSVRLNRRCIQRFSSPRASAAHHVPFSLYVSWTNGTVQYLGEEFGKHAITGRGLHGAIKLRGPRVDCDVRGSLRGAESAEFHSSRTPRRWNFSTAMNDASAGEIVLLVEKILHRPIVPEGWRLEGRIGVRLKGGGSTPIRWNAMPNFIQDGKVDLHELKLVSQTSGDAEIEAQGSLHIRGGQVSSSGLRLLAGKSSITVDGSVWPHPTVARADLHIKAANFDITALNTLLAAQGLKSETPLAGSIAGAMHIYGSLHAPEIDARLDTRDAVLWGYTVGKSVIDLHRAVDHWELREAGIKILDGTINATGFFSPQTLSLRLSAQGLDLADLTTRGDDPPVFGKLSAALTLQGPPRSASGSGSIWVSGLGWGPGMRENVSGQLQLSDEHLRVQAASPDGELSMQARAKILSPDSFLEELQIHLRSGGRISGQGALSPQLGIHIAAENLDVPSDAPRIRALLPGLQCKASFIGMVEGLWKSPHLKGTLTAPKIALPGRRDHSAIADVTWGGRRLEVTEFRLDPGYRGRWVRDQSLKEYRMELSATARDADAGFIPALLGYPEVTGVLNGHIKFNWSSHPFGEVDLQLSEGRLAKTSLRRLNLRGRILDGTIDLSELSFDAPRARMQLSARGQLPVDPMGHVTKALTFQGQWESDDPHGNWKAPARFNGEILPCESWQGQARVATEHLALFGIPVDDAVAAIHWDHRKLAWRDAAWGNAVKSHGEMLFGGKTTLAGEASFSGASLQHYLRWLDPKRADLVSGDLTGTLRFSGPVVKPDLDWSGILEHGHWRACDFEAQLSGRRSGDTVGPISVAAQVAQGGKIRFDGNLRNERDLDGQLAIQGLDLAILGKSYHLPQPLQGSADTKLAVFGTLGHPQMVGTLHLGPSQYGVPDQNPTKIESGDLDITFQPGTGAGRPPKLLIHKAIVKTAEEEYRIADGSEFDFTDERRGSFHLEEQLRNVHIGLFTLFGGMGTTGSWEILPTGFTLSGAVQTHSIFINDYQLDEGRIPFSYADEVLSFSAERSGKSLLSGSIDFHRSPQLVFHDFALRGGQNHSLNLSGELGPKYWDFNLLGTELDLRAVGELAGFTYPVEGIADLAVHGTGDINNPRVEGKAYARNGKLLGMRFSEGEAAFVWQNYRATITRLTLVDSGRYTLVGTGLFPLAPRSRAKGQDRTVDFSIELQNSNLSLLRSFSSEVKSARGDVQALVQVKGTAETPILRGSLRVTDGDVVGAHYFRHLSEFGLRAEFDGENLLIQKFQGTSGKGTFVGTGKISFAGFEPKFYDLHLNVPSPKPLDVVVPELAIPDSPLAKRFHFFTTASSCKVKGDVQFLGPADAPVFSGTATVSNGHFSFPPSKKAPPPRAFTEWMNRVDWNAALHFQDAAWFENELVEASLLGDLKLRGQSDQLRVDGSLEIPEGKISYLGIEFEIRQAHFDVRSSLQEGAVVNTPYMRGLADSAVQTVDPISKQSIDDTVTLKIDYAPVTEIKPRLTSAATANLTQDQLLARVTQLQTEDLTQAQRNYLYQQQMVRLIDTSLATPLARNLLKRTGLIDELSVSRVINPANASNNDLSSQRNSSQQQTLSLLAGTKYTLAKNLSSRLSLGYGVRFEQITTTDLQSKLDLRSDVELSYRWIKNVYLRGAFDLPSSTPGVVPDRRVTIEPRWRFGWWGNTNQPKAGSKRQRHFSQSSPL